MATEKTIPFVFMLTSTLSARTELPGHSTRGTLYGEKCDTVNDIAEKGITTPLSWPRASGFS
jgi:hypothetical protein